MRIKTRLKINTEKIIMLLFTNQSYILYNIIMKELNKIISDNLVMLRKKLGLKQSDVADKLNYSDKTVSKWETGEIIPNIENLIELCKLYDVSLEQITRKMDISEVENIEQKPDYTKRNKLIISLLSISAVWVLATVVFVYALIISDFNAWTVFVWAVPISFILAIIFNSLWGKKKLNYVFISILLWSLITCIYLQFVKYNLIALYFIGIPGQIAILLWSGLKSTK